MTDPLAEARDVLANISPGQWRAHDDDGDAAVRSDSGRDIAFTHNDATEDYANTILIAAAPRLLAALCDELALHRALVAAEDALDAATDAEGEAACESQEAYERAVEVTEAAIARAQAARAALGDVPAPAAPPVVAERLLAALGALHGAKGPAT